MGLLRLIRRPSVLLTVFALALVALVFSGVLDRFAEGTRLNRGFALASIVAYWLLALAAAGLVRAWRKDPRTVLKGVAAVLMTLVLIEVGIRLFHPHGATSGVFLHYSPRYHHVHPAGSRFELLDATFEINADGLRSPLERDEFLEHETRVAVLGDSFVFGPGVAHDKAVAQVLESELRERYPERDVAVLNAGTISYSPFLERLLFDDKVRHYRPDLVLLVLDVTDIGNDLEYERALQIRDGEPFFPRKCELKLLPAGPSWSDHVALYQRLYFVLRPLRLVLFHPRAAATCLLFPNAFEIELDGEIERNNYFIYRHSLAETGPYFRATLSHISEIAAMSREIGAEFGLVVSPRFDHWNPQECPDCWPRRFFSMDDPYHFAYFEFFEEARSEVDFPILSLLEAFQESGEFPLVFEFDPHWNESGHALAGRALADWVKEERLFERPAARIPRETEEGGDPSP